MSKDKKQPPCMFLYEEDGVTKLVKPVPCSHQCSTCAWNPAEKERRLKEGHFVDNGVAVIRHYTCEEDKKGKPVVYEGLKQLRFKSNRHTPKGETA